MYIYIYICMCIYIYIHTHTHIYIYIYTYMCVCRCRSRCSYYVFSICIYLNKVYKYFSIVCAGRPKRSIRYLVRYYAPPTCLCSIPNIKSGIVTVHEVPQAKLSHKQQRRNQSTGRPSWSRRRHRLLPLLPCPASQALFPQRLLLDIPVRNEARTPMATALTVLLQADRNRIAVLPRARPLHHALF